MLPTVALVLVLVTTTMTTDYGPGSTAPGATAPTYTFPIPVIDTLMGTLREEHRPTWRQARAKAIAGWTSGCVTFRVRVGTEAQYGTFDDTVSSLGYDRLLIRGSIIIWRDRSSAHSMMGGWSQWTGGGLAVFAPWAPWWRPYYQRQLVGVIAHELGHALGFGHGGTGPMGGGSDYPNATDLDLLRRYYCH